MRFTAEKMKRPVYSVRCFEKFTGSENDWESYVDLGDEKRKEVLAAAYRQFMLNQVVKALELSLEGYKQDNLPWR